MPREEDFVPGIRSAPQIREEDCLCLPGFRVAPQTRDEKQPHPRHMYNLYNLATKKGLGFTS